MTIAREITPFELEQYYEKADISAPSKTKGREDFCSFSANETSEMLKSGWMDGIKTVDKKISDFIQENNENKVSYSLNETGLFIDIPSYLAGKPECFIDETLERVEKPVLKLGINPSTSYGVKQDYIINRGACIMHVIDIMQNDYIVEIEIIDCTTGTFKKGRKLYGSNVVMRLGSDFSRSMLAFYLINPAFLRRCLFAVYEGIEKEVKGLKLSSAYGLPSDIKTYDGIYFPSLSAGSRGDYSTMGKAFKEVNKIAKQGV